MSRFIHTMLCATCLLVTSVVWLSAATANDRKPNFIVILADYLGYGDLSCFGADDIATPNIDRMGAEGKKFNSFPARNEHMVNGKWNKLRVLAVGPRIQT